MAGTDVTMLSNAPGPAVSDVETTSPVSLQPLAGFTTSTEAMRPRRDKPAYMPIEMWRGILTRRGQDMAIRIFNLWRQSQEAQGLDGKSSRK
ncbi:hypothetical protein MMC09_000514, partial [Bachmanniomyces sp. S44760]|nr:hypothetical protein [Bachmanniomyces sp. S44760]